MLIESMATSLVLGKVRGGKIKNIGNIDLKGWYFFVIGFGIEFGSIFLNMRGIEPISNFLNSYFMYLHGLSYILLLTGLILNFNKKSMIIIFIGTLLNFIVIASNSGMMPVDGEGLKALGLLRELEMLQSQTMLTHSLMSDSTRLVFLGDVLKTPSFYPLPKMYSIGDVFLAIGVFAFIQGAMNSIKNKYEGKMVTFSHK